MFKYVDDQLTENTQMTVDAYGQQIENVFFFSVDLSNPEAGYAGGQAFTYSNSGYHSMSLETTVNAGVNYTFYEPVLESYAEPTKPDLDDRRFQSDSKGKRTRPGKAGD